MAAGSLKHAKSSASASARRQSYGVLMIQRSKPGSTSADNRRDCTGKNLKKCSDALKTSKRVPIPARRLASRLPFALKYGPWLVGRDAASAESANRGNVLPRATSAANSARANPFRRPPSTLRTNEPPPPAVAIANNVVARPREAWAHHVLRLIGAL